MLKKLYKHEFYSLYRILIPLYAVLIALAGIIKITNLIGSDNAVNRIINGLSITLSTVSTISVFIVGFVIVVVRFYQNLLGKQGYLTFTLPFTATKHIICKLVCGVTVTITNVFATFLSLFIIFSGTDVINELIKSIKEGYYETTAYIGVTKLNIMIAEFAIILILSAFTSLLMYYACMSIGQQFKNRIFASIIAYFCIYAAWQFISSIFLAVGTLTNTFNPESLDSSSVFALSQGFIIFIIALMLAQGILYFFVTRYFLTKKLNLE